MLTYTQGLLHIIELNWNVFHVHTSRIYAIQRGEKSTATYDSYNSYDLQMKDSCTKDNCMKRWGFQGDSTDHLDKAM